MMSLAITVNKQLQVTSHESRLLLDPRLHHSGMTTFSPFGDDDHAVIPACCKPPLPRGKPPLPRGTNGNPLPTVHHSPLTAVAGGRLHYRTIALLNYRTVSLPRNTAWRPLHRIYNGHRNYRRKKKDYHYSEIGRMKLRIFGQRALGHSAHP